MRIPRACLAIAFLTIIVPAGAMAIETNGDDPLKSIDLSEYTGEQLFDSAYRGYVCSFLMTMAGQKEKGRALRSYSVKIVQEKRVIDLGKNWNDVNFPGGLTAFTLSEKYMEKFKISRAAAAKRFLKSDQYCSLLDRFIENVLINKSLK